VAGYIVGMNASFRLIAATVDRDGIIGAFENLATDIQARDDVDRVTALQRAVDEHPDRFEEYARAMR
jgi:hypothetical protein